MKILLGAAALLCTWALGARAYADGYCDHVEGVASAESALYYMPDVFGSVGYVENPDSGGVDGGDGLRVIAGVRLSVGDLFEASATKKRAHADCRRHQALNSVQGATTHAALSAKAAVLAEALEEAERLLDDANSDLKSRRATAQEVDATRLRVDDLRDLVADTQAALDALPAAEEGASLKGALADYYRADAAIEKQEGNLRSAHAWDLSLRIGYDKFLDLADDQPFFFLVTANLDLGWLVSGKANKKAAAGRARAVREEHDAGSLDVTASRLKSLLDSETTREQETAILLDDLSAQLKTLKKLGGDEGKRYRETVWFEWVKVNAEHAYFAAHVATLKEVLGQ